MLLGSILSYLLPKHAGRSPKGSAEHVVTNFANIVFTWDVTCCIIDWFDQMWRKRTSFHILILLVAWVRSLMEYHRRMAAAAPQRLPMQRGRRRCMATQIRKLTCPRFANRATIAASLDPDQGPGQGSMRAQRSTEYPIMRTLDAWHA